jgi:EF-P beta-lysylation protein EpmB
MIPLPIEAWQPDDWSRALADAITDVATLLERLDLDPTDVDLAPDFRLRVPTPFLARMRRGDRRDPLLRQVLPLGEERIEAHGFVDDPLAERAASRAPGLLQKYAGRALLLASGSCAVHCRYCFRREFPYEEHRQGIAFPTLTVVERDPSIGEVILSGGDPLMLKDPVLGRLVMRLDAIPHLTRLRIHTRLPVVIPRRVTRSLLEILRGTRLRVVVVLHVNHPNEIAGELPTALEALADAGLTLLNQSVLLAGVNDDADALVSLSERLFAHRVLPYYLHLPDAVRGTSHFHVTSERGRALVEDAARRLPGYLVPRLAREVPGLPYKEVISAVNSI